MRLRPLAVTSFLSISLLACGGGTAPVQAQYQPQITNATDSFGFQLTGVSNGDGSLSYTWRNTGAAASIDRSSAITSGTKSRRIPTTRPKRRFTSCRWISAKPCGVLVIPSLASSPRRIRPGPGERTRGAGRLKGSAPPPGRGPPPTRPCEPRRSPPGPRPVQSMPIYLRPRWVLEPSCRSGPLRHGARRDGHSAPRHRSLRDQLRQPGGRGSITPRVSPTPYEPNSFTHFNDSYRIRTGAA